MRRHTRAVKKALDVAGDGLDAATEKMKASNEAAHAQRVADAAAGENDVVRAQLESAAKLRRQGEKYLAEADEADAAGKAGKAKRLRRAAAVPLKQAEKWEAKAAAKAAELRSWAAEQD